MTISMVYINKNKTEINQYDKEKKKHFRKKQKSVNEM